ncbi:MAG: type II secretion system protein GspE, partial [Cellulosilyticaceae bacterium]
NSLVGVVAQRLVKKVCPYCKEVYMPTQEERHYLEDQHTYYRGRGCHNCNDSGYKGRIAVHEVLEIDGVIRKMITDKRPIEEVYNYVREEEMKFIKHQVLTLVEEGITTVDEYIRHTAFTI